MPKRTNRNAGIEALPSGKFRARAVGADGKRACATFSKVGDAKRWQAAISEARRKGLRAQSVDNRVTLEKWCQTWLTGQQKNRPSSYAQAKTHVNRINKALGGRRLISIAPSDITAWIISMQQEGLAQSTIYALHGRLKNILDDAILEGILTVNPCSRRTSPKQGEAKSYVCTLEQVWELYEAMPGLYKNTVLLGAFAGLRIAEVVAVHPDRDLLGESESLKLRHQYGGEPLKSRAAANEIAVPPIMIELIRESLKPFKDPESVVLSEWGRAPTPHRVGELFSRAVQQVGTLPDGFSFHDLRHFYASSLIAEGLDIKTIQHQVRHENASITLNTYGHLMESKKESARAAIAHAFTVPGGHG